MHLRKCAKRSAETSKNLINSDRVNIDRHLAKRQQYGKDSIIFCNGVKLNDKTIRKRVLEALRSKRAGRHRGGLLILPHNLGIAKITMPPLPSTHTSDTMANSLQLRSPISVSNENNFTLKLSSAQELAYDVETILGQKDASAFSVVLSSSHNHPRSESPINRSLTLLLQYSEVRSHGLL